MSGTNKNMHAAKVAKNDEFFTQFDDICHELCNKEYLEAFKGKKIYCPFDCPLPSSYYSQFYEFFTKNFNFLQLGSLLCTYRSEPGQPSVAYWTGGDTNGDGVIDYHDIETQELKGDGDWYSQEVQDFVKWADVIVSNVPFSIFRDIVDILMAKNKTFVLVGNKNAVIDKNIFPYLMGNKMFLGYTSLGEFKQPDGTLTTNMNGLSKWFTNIPLDKHNTPMVFGKNYYGNESEYPEIINMKGCILVDKVCNIPGDYFGPMAVPITFLSGYCPWQFNILGLSENKSCVPAEFTPLGKTFADEFKKLNPNTCYCDTTYKPGYYNKGIPKTFYTRLIIQRIK